MRLKAGYVLPPLLSIRLPPLHEVLGAAARAPSRLHRLSRTGPARTHGPDARPRPDACVSCLTASRERRFPHAPQDTRDPAETAVHRSAPRVHVPRRGSRGEARRGAALLAGWPPSAREDGGRGRGPGEASGRAERHGQRAITRAAHRAITRAADKERAATDRPLMRLSAHWPRAH